MPRRNRSAATAPIYQIGSVVLVRLHDGREARVHVDSVFGPGQMPSIPYERFDGGFWYSSGRFGRGMAFNHNVVRVIQLRPSVPIRKYRYRGENGYLVNQVFVPDKARAERIRAVSRLGLDGPMLSAAIDGILREGRL
jgi:hypothetical protein